MGSRLRVAAVGTWVGVTVALAGGSLAPNTASAVNDDATVVVAVSGTLNATFDTLLVPGLTPQTPSQVPPGTVPDRTLCDAQGGVYAPGPTDIYYSGTSKYTGTFEGTGRYCGHSISGVVQPDGSVPFIETDTFTGTVRGCGTGGITYSAHGFVSSRPDLAKQGLPAQEHWQIFPRTGTAGLRGLRSGGGDNEATIGLTADDAGTFTGSVTCVPASPPSASEEPAAKEARIEEGYESAHRAHGAKDHGETDGVTIVRGNWLGDLACAPTSAAPQPDGSTHVTCLAATGYAGAFTGHSYLTMTGDLAADGSSKANYEETIYALYLGDNSYGSLHVVGTLSVDAQQGFHALGRITEGSCGFSGSTGTITYDGTVAGGGFVAEWHRPSTRPSTAPCVPPTHLAPAHSRRAL